MPNQRTRAKAKAKRDAMRRLRASQKDDPPCMSSLSVDVSSHITHPPSTITTPHSSPSMFSPVTPPLDISPPSQIALGLAPPQGNGLKPKGVQRQHFTNPLPTTSSFHSSVSMCSPVTPPSDISPPSQIVLGLAPPQGNGLKPKDAQRQKEHFTHPLPTTTSFHPSVYVCSPVTPPEIYIPPPSRIALGLAPPQGDGINQRKDALSSQIKAQQIKPESKPQNMKPESKAQRKTDSKCQILNSEGESELKCHSQRDVELGVELGECTKKMIMNLIQYLRVITKKMNLRQLRKSRVEYKKLKYPWLYGSRWNKCCDESKIMAGSVQIIEYHSTIAMCRRCAP